LKRLLWLLPVSFILTACPFESNVPLETGPVQPVDSSLFGYWYGIVKDGSDFFGVEALEIQKESDSVYSIIRYGKSVKGDIILPDTAHFTGYISYLGGQPYMNLVSNIVSVTTKGKKKEPVVVTTKMYHIANFSMQHDTLTVKTVSEDFSPIKKVFKSPEELKQALLAARETNKNIFDDLFSISYHKIPKPQPLKAF
jgi:hypothetical protein